MKNNINIFLPCRKGSKRIKNKNTKLFYKYKFGLFENKIKQLLKIKNLNKIFVSTDDKKIIDYCNSINSKKITIIKRDKKLANDEASTDDLIKHVSQHIFENHIMWTHVSSPFITTKKYNEIIKRYYKVIQNGFDSLMTVSPIQTFLWNKKKPINYNRKIEKWPRTQTLKKIYEINSGVFLAHANIYKKQKDRVGKKIYLYELDKLCGFDIDWPNDFQLAEQILFSKIVKI